MQFTIKHRLYFNCWLVTKIDFYFLINHETKATGADSLLMRTTAGIAFKAQAKVIDTIYFEWSPLGGDFA